MTVKELIELLSDLPDDLEVFILNENDRTEMTPESVWMGCDNDNEELEFYEDIAANIKSENLDMTDDDVLDELCPVAIISVS